MSYELKSARYLARDVLARAVEPGDAVIDATLGNGHDTLFLCEAVLRENGVLDRARLYLCGHQHMDEYVKEQVRAAVFNLGWLPGGDHTVTTLWETTREAVGKALGLLLPGGVLVICAYPGHEEGGRERTKLQAFLSALDNRRYNVLRQHFLNAGPGAPECFVIQKNK